MKMYYDGWLKLSPALLRALGAKSGDTFAAELRDGRLVLTPVAGKSRPVPPDAAIPSPDEPTTNEERPRPRRSSGKTGDSAPSVVLPSGRRAGGRKPRPGG